MNKLLPSPEVLRKILRYEPETGNLFWRERSEELFSSAGYGGAEAEAARWNARFAGKPAMIESNSGYKRGRIFGVRIRAHRVIWAMQTGGWPEAEIDHINCDASDNRWANLRGATASENAQNRRRPRNNKSGYKGVSWDAQRGLWIASITARIGVFEDIEEAAAAYSKASAMLHGQFARTE